MKVEAVSRIATVPHLFETVGEAPCDHQQMFDLHFPLTWNITWSKNPSCLGDLLGMTYTTQFTSGLLHKLGVGFKYFVFPLLLGEDSQFD